MNHNLPIAEMLTPVARRAIDRILDAAESKIRSKWAEHKNSSTHAFTTYLRGKLRRCSHIKHFVYDDEVPIEKIYVPTNLKRRYDTLDQHQLADHLNNSVEPPARKRTTPAVSVIGIAGSGKSLFLRWLFINQCSVPEGRLPILYELRQLNHEAPRSLPDMIHKDMLAFDQTIMREQVECGLRNGAFFLLLDGFDEINRPLQEYYTKEVDRLSTLYPDCPLVVTGRPAIQMVTWPEVGVYSIAPLSKNRSIELIEKLQFNKEIRDQFIKRIRSSLYETHREFLQNPLLAVVMLLTFASARKIEREQHEFYADAVSALWGKHDQWKGSYERRRHTDLSKTQFIRAVSGLAASAYSRGHFDMTEDSFNQHSANAREMTGLVFSDENFLHDLLISTSLLVRDGDHVRFLHRILHEYFCALYVLTLEGVQLKLALESISDRFDTDSVAKFILALDPAKLEPNWVRQHLQRFMPGVRKCGDDVVSYLRFTLGSKVTEMNVIRELYKFHNPDEGIIGQFHAAFSYMVDRGTASRLVSDFDTDYAMIKKDRDKFIALERDVKQKYAGRSKVITKVFGSK